VRIVQVNAVYDQAARTPDALLDSYRTLTEWSDAVAKAGANVSVVQRFHTNASLSHNGVTYRFVADRSMPWLSTTEAPAAFVDAIGSHAADLVHVNGLIFPALVAAIRSAIGSRVALVAQHHGGEFPIRGKGFIAWEKARRWRKGLAAANAISFTAREQADPWRSADVVRDQRILEIIEASTTLRLVDRDRARAAIDVAGNPLILWVGRLTTNKDPLAVLDGLARALPHLPDARVVMVFDDATLLPEVEARVRGSEILRDRIVMAGRVSRDEMPNYYGAADLFVSGSHSEGSGYALIEAMAAGVVPIVTDIPSFRAIAGECGLRWAPGQAQQLADALLSLARTPLDPHQRAARDRFDRQLHWDAIGARTLSEYRSLIQ
jgi:glycosyltransferase involved in cell wall biosynthesis